MEIKITGSGLEKRLIVDGHDVSNHCVSVDTYVTPDEKNKGCHYI